MVLDLIAGGVIALAGVAVGRFLPARRAPLPEPPKPICSCGHALSNHDPKTRACNTANIRLVANREVGRANCPCLQYVGPEPLPTVYAPEVSG